MTLPNKETEEVSYLKHVRQCQELSDTCQKTLEIVKKCRILSEKCRTLSEILGKIK